MQKIIVAAKSANNIIGKDNDLVWQLPADWQFFLNTIKGAFLITGRKSYESAPGEEVFGKHQPFAVITRNKKYQTKNGLVAHSLAAAIALGEQSNKEKICILGGSLIYQQAMDIADKMIITEVHEHFAGDAFFPKIDANKWIEKSRIKHQKDQENPYDYSFVVYEKLNND